MPYVVATDGDDVRLDPHPAIAQARFPADGRPGTALDIEWAVDGGGRLALVDDDGREQAVVDVADGRARITVAGGAEPVGVPHAGGTLRLIADAQVLEVMADGGLVGLPLPPCPDGLVPHADRPNAINWWHLI